MTGRRKAAVEREVTALGDGTIVLQFKDLTAPRRGRGWRQELTPAAALDLARALRAAVAAGQAAKRPTRG